MLILCIVLSVLVIVLLMVVKAMKNELDTTHSKGCVAFEILYRAVSSQNELSKPDMDEMLNQIAVSHSQEVKATLADKILSSGKKNQIGFGA
jgi:competence protein ComGC